MPVLRLLRSTAFAVVCVTVSLGMHVFAGGAAVGLTTLAGASALVSAGAFVLARRRRGMGALLTAAFAAQYGLHHLFTAAAPQPPIPGHDHGGLAVGLTMLLAHAVTALLSAYWLERGETALATVLHLLVAAVFTLLLWRIPAVRPVVSRPAVETGPSFASRLLAAAVSWRGPPVGSFV
ncbi:hypothetical protein Aph01nite_22670 [Acrocarpospora phusangensis]|uniref:Uncharacterized protein n=1 Tax=Acrocarpospora phusangensis TaxID=1070424 RepID=A0A919UN09_9ACTN|nr:hypothetical protein [Acrocarpospora phusangensis]GIH23957.1 hypothetical protein Aph01nite_22670 [Acrocarpospora phusangensis]